MRIVRVVLALFLGAVSTAVLYLVWLWLEAPWSQPGSVNMTTVYGFTTGIWMVSTLLIGYGAHHLSAVFFRGCMLGLVEWVTLLLLKIDLFGGGSISDHHFANSGIVGILPRSFIAFFIEWIALIMAVVCVLGAIISYLVSSRSKTGSVSHSNTSP